MLLLGGRSSSWSGGVVLPTPAEVTFDGTNDYLTHSGDLTGAADTQSISIYLRARISSTTAGARHVFTLNAGTEPGVEVFLDVNERLRFRMTNTSDVSICVVRTSVVNDNTIYDYHFSYDGAAGVAQLYKNGTSDKSVVTETTGTVNMTGSGTVQIGAIPGPSNFWIDTIERLTIWNDVVLDCSNATVRANMADETQGSSLGNNIVDIFGAASDWNAGTNWGSGGDFTMNGAVV